MEEIPNDGTLFYRVHRTFISRDGDVAPGAFRDQGGAMSTDWTKYCATPEQSRDRARKPQDNAVVELPVTAVRHEAAQAVRHSPDSATNNRAHTDVIGAKTEEVRVALRRAARWALRLP